MTIWVVSRTFDIAGTGELEQIVSLWSSEAKARAAMAAEPNQESWYGKLGVSEWPVDD